MSQEQEIALIRGLFTTGFSRKDYELFVTSKRIVGIHTSSSYTSAGIFGAVGDITEFAIERAKKPKEMKINSLTIDELLKKDKNSFAFLHTEIKRVELRDGLIGGELRIKTASGNKQLSIEKEQVNTVLQALGKVEELSERFYV